MTVIPLKQGKEKSLLRHHPWVFSGALAAIPDAIAPGETVELVSRQGEFLARGGFSPQSQIAVRIWTFNADEQIDADFFHRRLQQAIGARARFFTSPATDAYRLVNAESDGLPGLILDRYGDYLVMQCLAAGVELWKEEIVRQIERLLPCRGVYERSDAEVRAKEGLAPVKGVLSGESPPPSLTIYEGSLKFMVDVVNGQKTGFYLDQRDNRKHLLTYASNSAILNCFAYSGAFGCYALHGGAAGLTNVEISASAMALLEENLRINGYAERQVENIQGDVFAVLRQFRGDGRQFDLIVLDPPKFVESRAQLPRACRGYKDISWLAFQLLRPGGILFTFSCSGLLEATLFQKIVADAALDAGRNARIVQKLGQASDHPVSLTFPEGDYLKGLICRVE